MLIPAEQRPYAAIGVGIFILVNAIVALVFGSVAFGVIALLIAFAIIGVGVFLKYRMSQPTANPLAQHTANYIPYAQNMSNPPPPVNQSGYQTIPLYPQAVDNPSQQQYPPPGQQQYPPPGQQQYPPPGQQQYPPPGQQQYPPPGQQQYPPPGQQQYPPSVQAKELETKKPYLLELSRTNPSELPPSYNDVTALPSYNDVTAPPS